MTASPARVKANEAALARLSELEGATELAALQRLRAEYEDRIRQLQVFENEAESAQPSLRSDGYESLLRDTLKTERQTILQLRNERVINDAVLRRIQRDLDFAEGRLRHPAD